MEGFVPIWKDLIKPWTTGPAKENAPLRVGAVSHFESTRFSSADTDVIDFKKPASAGAMRCRAPVSSPLRHAPEGMSMRLVQPGALPRADRELDTSLKGRHIWR